MLGNNNLTQEKYPKKNINNLLLSIGARITTQPKKNTKKKKNHNYVN